MRPTYDRSGIYIGDMRRTYKAGAILFRPAKSWHRLEITPGETAHTLFITGPKRQSWGFLKEHDNKIYHRNYDIQHEVIDETYE